MSLSPATLPRWTWSAFEALSASDLIAILRLRQQVFVVEQHCPYQDLDGLDERAWHLAGWHTGSGQRALIAYLRVVLPGDKYPEPSIGRVVADPGARGLGLGRALMVEGLARTGQQWPGQAVRISAQAYLQRFYESLDFAVCSAPYDEDGIEHLEMLRPGRV